MIGSVIDLLILERKAEVTIMRTAVRITNGMMNDYSMVCCTAIRTDYVLSSMIYFGKMTTNW
jgi:hypothetical protein